MVNYLWIYILLKDTPSDDVCDRSTEPTSIPCTYYSPLPGTRYCVITQSLDNLLIINITMHVCNNNKLAILVTLCLAIYCS